MINCTYNFNNFEYQVTDSTVSVKVDYTRYKGDSVQKRVWKGELTHDGAATLGLDNTPGEAFSGRDIKVVLEGDTIYGAKIPAQVCLAIEEIERNAADRELNDPDNYC